MIIIKKNNNQAVCLQLDGPEIFGDKTVKTAKYILRITWGPTKSTRSWEVECNKTFNLEGIDKIMGSSVIRLS